ncbi:hypothetical protein MSS93_05145 [Deinococcus radiodurans]|nr:hypothetical protein MSS93_05145 [Deinococcus radiodurans]
MLEGSREGLCLLGVSGSREGLCLLGVSPAGVQLPQRQLGQRLLQLNLGFELREAHLLAHREGLRGQFLTFSVLAELMQRPRQPYLHRSGDRAGRRQLCQARAVEEQRLRILLEPLQQVADPPQQPPLSGRVPQGVQQVQAPAQQPRRLLHVALTAPHHAEHLEAAGLQRAQAQVVGKAAPGFGVVGGGAVLPEQHGAA